jgi:thiol:disulfide interchange protein DsbD
MEVCFAMSRIGISVLLALVSHTAAIAQPAGLSAGTNGSAPAVTAWLVADTTAIVPGKPLTVAVKLDVPKGYYTYYKSPGGIGLPTKISISAPAGFKVGPIRFPGPEVKHEELAGRPVANFLYRRTTFIIAKVTPPDSLPAGAAVELSGTASFQYCQESGACYPPKPSKLTLSLPVAAHRSDAQPSSSAKAIADAEQSLPSPGTKSKYAKVRAVLSQDKIRPGDEATLGIVVSVDPGYKLQMHRPPVAGLVSTELILETTPGFEPWPDPIYPLAPPAQELVAGFEHVREYRGQFTIKVPVKASKSLAGSEVSFRGLLHYQACAIDGACFPARYASFELTVPVAATGSAVSRTHTHFFGSGAGEP